MKPFTKIAALIFCIVALGHLLRLLLHVSVTVGSHTIPFWISVAGIIIPLGLSYGQWKEAK